MAKLQSLSSKSKPLKKRAYKASWFFEDKDRIFAIVAPSSESFIELRIEAKYI